MQAPLINLKNDVRVIIPTYNAEKYFSELAPALLAQGIDADQLLIIDSSSTDGTAESFRNLGAKVEVIPHSQFNHGATRRDAVLLAGDAEYLIFLTQDAVPASSDAFQKVLDALSADAQIGMAYGRQLPRAAAGVIESHARLRNYPDCQVEVRTLQDRASLGIKTVFCSNSFAVYRRSALADVGNFPDDALFAEDQITAGRLLLHGWKIAYAGNACVTHSHGYTITQEFKRYFDVGVFHARNLWLLEAFGIAEGEGSRFMISEFKYLLRHQPAAIPSAFVRTVLKYLGYRLGRSESRLPSSTKARLSMHSRYWTIGNTTSNKDT